MNPRYVVLGITFFIASHIVSSAQAVENIFPNIGSVGIGTGLNGPLNKLHIHLDGVNAVPQPVLRFSYGGLPPTNAQPFAQLAFCSTVGNALNFSSKATASDLIIRTAPDSGGSGSLILSTQNVNGSILFTTAQTVPVLNTPATDHERMRINALGHVGILQEEPQELLHIGAKMTFHVGYANDYLGYNVYRDGSNIDRLIVGTATTDPGFPLKYGMTRDGVIEIGAGSTLNGATGDEVNWWEGGVPRVDFSGMTMKNINGKARVSFGRYLPDELTRVLIKAPFENSTCSTDCKSGFKVISSNDDQLFCVRDGNVIIGSKMCTTNAPGFNIKLSVDGIVFTKELVVTTSPWADHVFADDYSLMPLADLRTFIDENKRLPGIPSEQEVKRDGVRIGEIQARLLEKIEQLTLYMIELSQQNETLRVELDELKERVR